MLRPSQSGPQGPLTGAKDMWRNASPTGAIGDFITVFKQAGKHRWWVAVLAAMTTTAIFSIMAGENWIGPRPKPKITWITTFAPDRSEADILAGNIANQKRKDALAAEQAKREAEVRDLYTKIGEYSGIDVEAAKKQGEAERAAAAAKLKAEQAEALRKVREAELAGKR
ncbi:hypothetical protein ACOYW6_09500 [Parablastomonas sp. CN1-191]|uniref:hypothetical protein n=1 Tax=Parablastomonas sp. CN1-191 TaxID=3400908 RepID=UPI003BF8B35C